MKNLLESFAILLVGLLSIGVVYLIVQYNMIDDQNFIDPLDKSAYEMPTDEELEEDDDLDDDIDADEDKDDIDADEDIDLEDNKENSYLQNLEGYTDVDVEVDATKEDRTNTVIVVSAERDNDLESAVEDKSKSSYMKNLENYTEKVETREELTPADDKAGEPQKLEYEEIADEVGMAIDSALSDI